jgi:predicted nucleic-acid-binding protein
MKETRKTIAIDSNVLTFFVEAIEADYDPARDRTDLAAEKVAVLRIYFYTGEPYYIVPTAEKEYKDIVDRIRRTTHEEVHAVLMLDFVHEIEENAIKQRADFYFRYHPSDKDCRILAEAELGGIEILLTFDGKLINRLKQITKSIKLMRPSEFWQTLNIPSGARRVVAPHRANPLSRKTWWVI